MENIWFDTHAHLADAKFDPDRREAIARAFSAGVNYIVEIGEAPDEWEKARKLSDLYPDHIWWSLGLHPYFSDRLNEELMRQMEKFLPHPRLVGIGEVGLDYAKSSVSREVQVEVLNKIIRLAQTEKKPLIIHCREAYQDLIPLLKSGGASRGVIHCFSGNTSQAKDLLDLGFYIGVDGPLTYPNAKGLREALAIVPLERIVLETDCPYLPPQNHRGQRNEPSYIPQIGQYLAGTQNSSPEEVARISTQNAFRLFGINHP